MKLGVYSIRDNLTGFLTPVTEQNDRAAIRNFEHACRQPNSLMFSHISDYDLYKVGWYDTDTGALEPVVPIEMVASGGSMNDKVQSL